MQTADWQIIYRVTYTITNSYPKQSNRSAILTNRRASLAHPTSLANRSASLANPSASLQVCICRTPVVNYCYCQKYDLSV